MGDDCPDIQAGCLDLKYICIVLGHIRNFKIHAYTPQGHRAPCAMTDPPLPCPLRSRTHGRKLLGLMLGQKRLGQHIQIAF